MCDKEAFLTHFYSFPLSVDDRASKSKNAKEVDPLGSHPNFCLENLESRKGRSAFKAIRRPPSKKERLFFNRPSTILLVFYFLFSLSLVFLLLAPRPIKSTKAKERERMRDSLRFRLPQLLINARPLLLQGSLFCQRRVGLRLNKKGLRVAFCVSFPS